MNNRAFKQHVVARLFVIASQIKMHPEAFASSFINSDFASYLEKDIYDDKYNISILDIFNKITGLNVSRDDSFGVYDDAYWAGHTYYELMIRRKKSFAFLMIKLPLKEMLDLHPVYHEMDLTAIEEYLNEKDKSQSIIKCLLKRYGYKLTEVSKKTKISISTLRKYSENDALLYRASFKHIYLLKNFFEVPYQLFLESI